MENLKHVRGEYKSGSPANIYYFSDVSEWDSKEFLAEFDYLVEYVKPSVINVHINSTGGSCIDGIGIFSKIIDCPIPVHCYNDGLAASIASVIWAAGKKMFMKDYALLMIHNPFINGSTGTENEKAIVDAFIKQIVTIYKTRFGLSDERIKEIMDGEEGKDGTFFTAEEAVKAGFLPKENVIVTTPILRESIAAKIHDIKDLSEISKVMESVEEPKKPTTPKNTITEKEQNSLTNPKKSMEKDNFTVFAALLGISSEKATEESVCASISELKDKAKNFDTISAELESVKNELNECKTKLTGAETAKANLMKDLQDTKDSLQVYVEKENAEKEAAIVALVENAINDCKINKDAKETWIEMAKNNFELTKNTLDSIPARDNIGKEVAKANEQKAEDGLKDAEAELKAKVDAVVGADFKFRHI